MKVAIIQLSDIHIKSKNDFILQHVDEFVRSCKHIINECFKLVFVITGDIANQGSKEEYDLAYDWLKSCETGWKKEALCLNSIDYVIVPGNHDCDFSSSVKVRKIIIDSILKNDKLENKEIKDECLKVQANFWNFKNRLCNEKNEPSISWTKEIILKLNYKIIFNCYNTAFTSQINESPGCLIIPEDSFIDSVGDKNTDIVISLFHHNSGWITPNSPNNNKKRFEDHLYSNSNIVMCGHEHFNISRIVSNLTERRELVYLENSALQSENSSEYGLLLLDTDTDSLTSFTYKYNNDYYEESGNGIIAINRKQTGISLTDAWIEKLEKIDMPLKHIRKENLYLSDIFVYPDLEPISEFHSKNVHYIDSETIINDNISERVIFLEGESQSGKSSLLQMLFSAFFKRGEYPIYINGKQIKHYNISDVIEREYKKQYQNSLFPYEKYEQLDRSKHVLLIDDFDTSILNQENKSKLLDKALCNFERIIITNSQQISISNILLHTNKEEIKRYRILSLGYSKRNILIEKWIRLGQDKLTIDEEAILNQVKNMYDKVTVLLGQQLIPSYPVFILSLLQGLNQALENFDISQTSYAYCYNSLIMSSLIKTGTEKEKTSGVIKFLSEFSYSFYSEKTDSKYFTVKDYKNYYTEYEKEYNVPYTVDTLLSKLINANLIRLTDEDCYSFAYKYVFYYLVAQKISQLVNDNKADGIIKKLCDNLHKEREANILIFLVYHNGTEKQMEELLFASWLPFENEQPITLEVKDPLFSGLKTIVDSIKSQVMLQNVDPKKNREIILKESDKRHRELNSDSTISEKDFEDNKCLRELNNTFKIIKILGQIVKNQKETLKKDQILRLIEESYKVCFRSIAFFNRMIEDSQEDIVSFFLEQNNNGINLSEDSIREKVTKFLHMLLYHNCLLSFAHLSCAVGTSDMISIYDEIAERFNTPAAKIITFTIKTYYNKMKFNDLEKLVSEFKSNPVAMEFIKARVLNYVYNNYVELSDRQKIGQLCDLKLVNNTRILSNHEKRPDKIL